MDNWLAHDPEDVLIAAERVKFPVGVYVLNAVVFREISIKPSQPREVHVKKPLYIFYKAVKLSMATLPKVKV